MRTRLLVLTAVSAFLPSLLLHDLYGQQTPGGSQPPAAQGAPEGRGGRGVPEAQGGRGGQGDTGQGRQGVLGGIGGPTRGRGPAGPTPRRADGTVILGGVSAKDMGIWLPGNGGAQTLYPVDAEIPLQPWARAVLADRLRNQLEPHTRCKPSGAARQFLTPYGVEIVEFPEFKRVYIFDIGGPHTYRTIYLDGRSHPATLEPSYYGHSIGRWEGDTLVVDTVGYNEGFWIDRRGTPHTEKLHTIERFTRTDQRTLQYELTVDDPGAYTASWKSGFNFGWSAGEELFEYVCQQANYADNLMVGEHTSVDRTTPIVP